MYLLQTIKVWAVVLKKHTELSVEDCGFGTRVTGFQRRLLWITLFSLIGVVFGCESPKDRRDESNSAQPERIISLAPSITETLFALGLGDRVVGVTSFCKYPPAVDTIPKVGGYVSPGFEVILGLEPDLVVILEEQTKLIGFLKKRGISFARVDNHDIAGILSSIRVIGTAAGIPNKAERLIEGLELELAAISQSSGYAPRVLVCVEHANVGSGAITKAWCAAPGTLYDDLIRRAGGENVIADPTPEYPTFSAEGILHLNPEIIIDLSACAGRYPVESVREDWSALQMVPAVERNNVFCPTQEYLTIPGPRIFKALKEFRRILGESTLNGDRSL